MLAFDVPLSWEDPAAAAARAEADGMDGVWTAEGTHDPHLTLAVAATATRRIVLGTAITVAFVRSPMVHAMTFWDLHRMAPGRVVLGLGSQVKAHNQRRYSVAFDHPAPRMRDMIRAIRAIWRCWQYGEALDYRGEFYTHTLMTPFFNPGPVDGPMPRIFVAAVNPHMLAVAGAEADGVHVHPLHSERTLDQLTIPSVRRTAAAAGRDAGALEFCAPAMIATGRDADAVAANRDRMRSQVAFYASTRTYRGLLEEHDRGELCDALHALSLRGAWEEMPRRIDDELLDAFCVSATWEDLAAALVRRYASRVQRIMPYALGAPETPWASIAAEIRAGAVGTAA
ncbi:MAG TPA: TIGR03617 family F420-dependent LLM class oxidoreductase [Candidatus Dormibacteraeota bacterium]|nr:TIGR03617 family F420-dependent LLM class oxidoreductase [Candidatus Dormibacteraeota bacterium]